MEESANSNSNDYEARWLSEPSFRIPMHFSRGVPYRSMPMQTEEKVVFFSMSQHIFQVLITNCNHLFTKIMIQMFTKSIELCTKSSQLITYTTNLCTNVLKLCTIFNDVTMFYLDVQLIVAQVREMPIWTPDSQSLW